MKSLSSLVCSLSLAMSISFATPAILVGISLGMLMIFSYFPLFNLIAHQIIQQILSILAILGSGLPLQGILTISLSWAFVGGLFDLFNILNFSRSAQN